MIRMLSWDERGNTRVGGFDPDLVAALRAGRAPAGTRVWVDVQETDEAELGRVGQAFGFHALSLEDCLHLSEVPKLEEFPDYVFLVVHSVVADPPGGPADLPELNAFFGRDFLVTVHLVPLSAVDSTWDRHAAGPGHEALGLEFVLHAVLDNLVDGFFPLVRHWEEHIEELEDDIMAGKSQGVLATAAFVRRSLLRLRRTLGPQRQLYDRLARADFPFVSPAATLYFRDVYDHAARLHEMIEIDRELLNTALEAYLSLVSNRTNRIMQKLTVVTSIFLPLTFIAGIYGMNFRFMPELSSRYGYLGVWIVMLALSGGMVAYFHRRGWLD